MHWTTIFLIGCIVLGGTFRLGYELGRWVEKHDRSKR